MSFLIEMALRRIIIVFVAVSIGLAAFGSGFPASHAMAGITSCAGLTRVDAGRSVTSLKETRLSQAEARVSAETWTVAEPAKQTNGATAVGAECCGSYCAPAFSLSAPHPGMIFSRGNGIWPVARNLLQSTDPSGLKRPPRSAVSPAWRA